MELFSRQISFYPQFVLAMVDRSISLFIDRSSAMNVLTYAESRFRCLKIVWGRPSQTIDKERVSFCLQVKEANLPKVVRL